MTFATEIAKVNSYRHTLVRLTPARNVTTQLASSGGLYVMTFPYPVAKVERNGVELTEVNTTPSVNDTFASYDSGLFQVKLGSAPNATSNIIVIYYYLFYASDAVSAYETPTDSATSVRPWEPALVSDPVFTESLSESFFGILTVQPTSVSLRNRDHGFQAYLTSKDSFANKACEAWLDVNGQLQKVFSGLIEEISIDGDTVTLSVHDEFERLNHLAYMGDDFSDAHYLTTDYTDMDPRYHLRPCRYVVGHSRYDFRSGKFVLGIGNDSGGGTQGLTVLDFEKCEQAVPTFGWLLQGSSLNPGPYALCRTSAAGLKSLNFGTILTAVVKRSDVAGTRYTYGAVHFRPQIQINYSSGNRWSHNLEVGDSFTFTHASLDGGATQYAVVMSVYLQRVNCMLLSRAEVAGADVTITTATFNSNSYPAIGIMNPYFPTDYGPVVYMLVGGIDYTLNTTTLASGNKFYTISLTSGFETALTIDTITRHPGIGGIDPNYVMFFRVSTDQGSNLTRHDEALKQVLTAAGLDCDSATFAAAGAAYGSTVSFTIPALEDTEVRPYFEYAQMILRSTLGYLSFNTSDGEIEYTLVAVPSSSDDVDDTLVLDSIPSISIDYREVYSEVSFYNHHVPGAGYWWSYSSNYTASSNAARYLHGIDKKISIEHVLDAQQASVDTITRLSTTILNAYSSRRAKYTWRMATKLLDAAVGGDIQLTHDGLLGAAASDDLKLITLTKSADEVVVEATDLEGV